MGAACQYSNYYCLGHCNGQNTCNKLHDKVKGATGDIDNWLKTYCPIFRAVPTAAPTPSSAKWFQDAKRDYLDTINGVLGTLRGHLEKKYCLWLVEASERWVTHWHTTHVPYICCDNRRRRRWCTWPRCRTCWWVKRWAVPFWEIRIYESYHCLSAYDVITALAGFLKALFGPVLDTCNGLVRPLFTPLENLFQDFINEFTEPLNPILNFSLSGSLFSVDFPSWRISSYCR